MTEQGIAVLRAPRISGEARVLGAPLARAEGKTELAARPSANSTPNGRPVEEAPVIEATPEPVVPPELVKAAEKRGYEAGFELGAKAGQQEFQVKVAQVEQLLTSIGQKRDDLLEVLEEDLVELVFELIGHFAGLDETRRDLVVETVRRQLATRAETQILTVRVAAEDLVLVSQSEAAGRLGLGSRLQLVADPAVRLGGCIIDTAQGSLDARLELLLEKLRRALLEGRRSAESPETFGA